MRQLAVLVIAVLVTSAGVHSASATDIQVAAAPTVDIDPIETTLNSDGRESIALSAGARPRPDAEPDVSKAIATPINDEMLVEFALSTPGAAYESLLDWFAARALTQTDFAAGDSNPVRSPSPDG